MMLTNECDVTIERTLLQRLPYLVRCAVALGFLVEYAVRLAADVEL
jgi:hypothetical protein